MTLICNLRKQFFLLLVKIEIAYEKKKSELIYLILKIMENLFFFFSNKVIVNSFIFFNVDAYFLR